MTDQTTRDAVAERESAHRVAQERAHETRGDDWLDQASAPWQHGPNLGAAERAASAVGGAALLTLGVARRSFGGALAAVGGGLLAWRGFTGRCRVYQRFGVRSTNLPSGSGRRVRVRQSVTVSRSREDLFEFWRDIDDLSQFMSLLRLLQKGDRGSGYHAGDPFGEGVHYQVEHRQPEFIEWRAVQDEHATHFGRVEFVEAPAGRGVEVSVEVDYEPYGGAPGVVLATLTGNGPKKCVREGLRRFKQLVEAGDVLTTRGQPVGSCGIL